MEEQEQKSIKVFVATEPEYWGDGWNDLTEEEQDYQIERYEGLVRQWAKRFGYTEIETERVGETFSRPHRNEGDADEIEAQAWDAWCRGEEATAD